MYEEFYGFREKPFSLVPDPGFLYLSAQHRTALTYLEYGLTDQVGFILLTGEIGAGKTTIIKQLLTQIGNDLEVAVVFNTNVFPEQLLGLILDDFQVKPRARSKAAYLEALYQFLIDKYAQGHRALLVLDEAQNLSQEALEEVRMISNLQTGKDALIQIVLVGQPELRTRLQQPSLAQLGQRIAVSYHLAPLSSEETGQYIAHRLKRAGADDEQPFTPEAVERIFHHSRGIPRTINILCDAALVYGYADELKTIDGQVVEHVVRDKQELGIFVPSGVEQKTQCADDRFQNNGRLLRRIENIEAKVSKLSAMIECQIQEQERRAESYKDTLVQRLETMLAEERKRSDRLLIQYNRLRDRLNLKKLNSQDKKSEPSVEKK